MNILVTGGAGFIGSNFIRFWLKNHSGDFITNLDSLTYAGHLESTNDYKSNPNYKFVKGDICDSGLVNELTKGIDTLVHFAAESHVDRSIKNPEAFVKTNVLGTQTLLDTALKNNIKHFHHVSTDEVFGTLEMNGGKFTEHSNYDPHSPYAASKAGSDHLVRAYRDTYGLPITITNCGNNFGPFHDPEKLFARSITNLIAGQPIKIYGDGNYVRDWIYVEDHCKAIELVLTKGQLGETYLVGSSYPEITNLEVARKMLKLFNLDESHIKFVKDRAGHDRRYALDAAKIKALGWTPEADFDTRLKQTVDWFKENEWWWKPLKQKSEDLYTKTGQI
jgi:dTDP-glucose 4,6-dehydratase